MSFDSLKGKTQLTEIALDDIGETNSSGLVDYELSDLSQKREAHSIDLQCLCPPDTLGFGVDEFDA